MTIEELIKLSVKDLGTELEKGGRSVEELKELLRAEEEGENRSTAVKEIKAAIADASEDDTDSNKRASGVYVKAGKSVTTKSGIKGPGDLVKPEDLPEKSAEHLVKKGYLEVQE